MRIILKKQPILQRQKLKPSNCPTCKRNQWLEFEKGYYCQNCEYKINKQNIRLMKKFVDETINFQLDCHMRIKGLEKLGWKWLILLIIQQTI